MVFLKFGFSNKAFLWILVTLFFFQIFSVSKASGDQENIVKLKQNSFEPKKVAVNKGDKVVFKNEDQKARWPASNIHPTHGIYPEFDPKNPIEPGNSWEFKFEKVGTFKFHDHLQPTLGGEIFVSNGIKIDTEVEERAFLKKNPSLSILLKKTYYFFFPQALKKDLGNLNSLKTSSNDSQLGYWIKLIGGRKYMEELVKDSGGGSLRDCHQEAHLTGRKTYEIEGKKVFRRPDYNCHSGYLHGALEAFMSSLSSKDLIREVEKLCKGLPTSFSEFECLHGIGHGLEAYADYDLPEALTLCKKLSKESSQTSCFGGVFMENIMVAEGKGAVLGHKTYWVSSDPHFPCNGIDKDYKIQFQCYQMQTSRMLQLKPKNFNFLREQCLNAPDNMTEACFVSMGRDIAGQTLRDPQKTLNLCKGIPQEYFGACIRGSLNVIIDFWGEDITDQPQKLCQILDKEDKRSCFVLLGDRLKGIFGQSLEKINKICKKGEKEYLNFCLNGSSKT